ncbi:MAG: NRDE family protein [Bacteroidota bacterium]
MCTVSFLPLGKKICITSNRDEHISRKSNLIPTVETLNGKKIFYPKDSGAGGTWFSLNEDGTVIVLLNGAFANHKRQPPYRKSRGLIVLDIISQDNTLKSIRGINLESIEPFTLVVFRNWELWELRWDGTQKHLKQLDSAKAYLWSSWTLYDKGAQTKRNGYFERFIVENEVFDTEKILNFHRENHGDHENGFVIDRQNGLKTLSITQAVLEEQVIVLDHYDLDSGGKESITVPSTSLVTPS